MRGGLVCQSWISPLSGTRRGSRIGDPSGVAAAQRATRVMPGLAIPLDGIAGTVARLLRALIGAVSVISGDFDECVGAYGLPPPLSRHVPLPYSVCQYVVSAGRVLAVPDMAADPDLRDHPARRAFGVNAFAGVPLRNGGGQPVGALTVVDYVPREWTAADLDTLAELATLIGPIPSSRDEPDLGVLRHDQAGPAGDLPVSAATQADVREGLLTALLDSLQVGVLAVDGDGAPVLFNRMLRRIYGIGEGVPVRQAADIAGHEAGMSEGCCEAVEQDAVRRALGGEHVRGMEAVVEIAGLPRRNLVINSEPVRAPAGRLLGAVSTVLDVTAARRAEQIRDAELQVAGLLNRAHTVQEVAPAVAGLIGSLLRSGYVALWLVDRDQDAMICAACWTAPGITMTDVIPERITRQDSGPGRVWATGEPLYIPNLAHSRDHTEGPARGFAEACVARGLRTVVALPLRDGDEILGVLSCLSRGTDDEAPHVAALIGGIAGQIGAFLTRERAADLARQLDRAREDFALVGHALRTPLQSVTAYTELVCDDPDLPEDARRLLQTVLRNAGTLSRIVTDLMELSALETGEDALQYSHVDLGVLIADAVRAAKPAAASAGTTLEVRLGVGPHLRADGRRLRQLLDHLIDNAVIFSPQGRVRVEARDAERGIELTVTDDGMGIPPEQRDRVFDRFFRADNVMHGDTNGAGLGLSLVQAIARAHAGGVSVAEHSGPGTTIAVRLPHSPPPRGKPSRPNR